MPEALVDRELLEKLERLAIGWLRSYQGVLGGHNRSRLPGYGQEFLDHRNFYAGDDLRAVNWRAYLRFERFLLKTFELEPRVPIRLLLDTSASMSVGSKFEYARRLALALVYIALVKLDTVTLQSFSGALFRPLQATGGRQHIHHAESFLRALYADGQTDFRAVVRSFLSSYRKPGLLILISDFLPSAPGTDARRQTGKESGLLDSQEMLQPLQMLADFGHELLLIQVWDWADRHPGFTGACELIDSETGAKRLVQFDARSQRAYTARMEAHTAALKRFAARNSGRFADVCTRTPIEEALFGPVRAVIGQN